MKHNTLPPAAPPEFQFYGQSAAPLNGYCSKHLTHNDQRHSRSHVPVSPPLIWLFASASTDIKAYVDDLMDQYLTSSERVALTRLVNHESRTWSGQTQHSYSILT